MYVLLAVWSNMLFICFCYYTEPIRSKLTNLVPILVQLLTRDGLSHFMLINVVFCLGNLTEDNRELT